MGAGLGLGRTLHDEMVATVADHDPEALLDEMQVFVKLPAQARKSAGIAGFKDELEFRGLIQRAFGRLLRQQGRT